MDSSRFRAMVDIRDSGREERYEDVMIGKMKDNG